MQGLWSRGGFSAVKAISVGIEVYGVVGFMMVYGLQAFGVHVFIQGLGLDELGGVQLRVVGHARSGVQL